MPTLQKTKARIAELVPEVMELKFGCEIIHNGIEQTIVHCSQSHPFWFSAITDRTDGKIIDFDKSKVTILGSPITLADVLQAIETTKYYVLVSMSGRFHLKTHDETIELCNWDLRYDLDHQTVATQTAIGELLA